MPQITAAAAAVSPAPAAAPAAGSTSGGSATATSGTPNPFAALLQQQMSSDGGVALPTTTVDAASATANLTTDALDQALVALTGGLQGTAATTDGDPTVNGKRVRNSRDLTKDEVDAQAAAAQLVPIAAPAIVAPSTVVPAVVGASQDTTAQSAGTKAESLALATASAAANLAAESDSAGAAKAGANSETAAFVVPGDASLQASAAANRSPTVEHVAAVANRVDSAVGTTAWKNDVANNVAWMANQGHSRAELVLTPPELGRVGISLSISGDQATATFVSANPAVREALENAMPRLREVLADAGVTLGQTHVGTDTFGQSANSRENGDNPSWNQTSQALASDVTSTARVTGTSGSWHSSGRGMVDVFA